MKKATSPVPTTARAFWIYDAPYYYLNSQDKLIRKGSFVTGRPFVTQTYKWFNELKKKSYFLKRVNAHIPFKLRKKDAELTARVLIESGKIYKKQFHRRFFVLFHPGWDLNKAEDRMFYGTIHSALKEAEIEILDYSALTITDEDVINILCDQHPSGKISQQLASLIALDLNQSR